MRRMYRDGAHFRRVRVARDARSVQGRPWGRLAQDFDRVLIHHRAVVPQLQSQLGGAPRIHGHADRIDGDGERLRHVSTIFVASSSNFTHEPWLPPMVVARLWTSF